MKYGKLDLDFDGFDWDDFNSRKVKGRIPLEDIEAFFKNKILVREDTRHSLSEQRFIAMGEVNKRVLFVSYTVRQKGTETLIRVISSRYVHSNSREKELYEKAKEIFKKE